MWPARHSESLVSLRLSLARARDRRQCSPASPSHRWFQYPSHGRSLRRWARGGQIMDSHWQPEAPSQTQSGIIRLWAPAEVSSESQSQPGGSRWPAGTDSESVRRHCTCKRLQSEAALPDASESRTGGLPGGPAATFQSVQY